MTFCLMPSTLSTGPLRSNALARGGEVRQRRLGRARCGGTNTAWLVSQAAWVVADRATCVGAVSLTGGDEREEEGQAQRRPAQVDEPYGNAHEQVLVLDSQVQRLVITTPPSGKGAFERVKDSGLRPLFSLMI